MQRVTDQLAAWREQVDAATAAGQNAPSKPDVRDPGAKGGEVRTNRLLSRLRHIYSWAIEDGYTERTPFQRAGKTVVKLESSVEEPRNRRLEGDEAERLLKHAGPHLHHVIVAALDTGMRRGEILGLRWSHVLSTNGRTRRRRLPCRPR